MKIEATKLKGELLGYWNDQIDVLEYGEGHLLHLPWRYADDDAVSLFIEPFGDQVRITDHGSTYGRLTETGKLDGSGRFASAWKSALGAVRSHDFGGSYPDEISVVCERGDVPEWISTIASACLRAEQTELVANPYRRVKRFDTRVVNQVERFAEGHGVRLDRRPAVHLKSGRDRHVTARAVPTIGTTVWLQAVGGNKPDDRETQLDRCYYTFSHGEFGQDRRIAVLSGVREQWPSGIGSELESAVDAVVFLDESARSLARTLESQMRHPEPLAF